MLIDTHAHIYLSKFDKDLEKVLNRAFENDIKKIIVPNIDENTKDAVLALCEKYPDNLFPALGLHPTSVKNNYKEQIELIFNKINKNVKIIGEIGIDLYWDKSLFKQQQEAFRLQLEYAIEKDLPVIIHSRGSMKEILNVISEFKKESFRGVFHCYSGDYNTAKKIIDMGFYIGIGGVLTYKNSNLYKIVENIPLEKILLETDSPFLPPVPYRGKRNEPAYLFYVASKIAEIKNVDLKTVAETTSVNAKKLFSL